MTIDEINEIRRKLLTEALWAWVNNGFKGTINLPTGTGKTWLIVRAAGGFIRKNPNERWLVIVPKTNLKENEIPDEFKKWGYLKEFNKSVTVECIQTAYKRTGEHWDGIAVDEVHTTLSNKYKMLFANNSFNRLLCVSATIEDEDKLNFLSKIAPIVFKRTIKQIRDLGIISDYRIFNLAVAFTDKERIDYKKANSNYRWFESRLVPEQEIVNKGMLAFKRANLYLNKKVPQDKYTKEQKDDAAGYLRAVRSRKELFQQAANKITTTIKIIDKFSGEYGIFFSESTKVVDQIYEATKNVSVRYHFKMSNNEKREALKTYRDKRTKKTWVISAKSLIAGLNIKQCTYGICGSGPSKSLDQIQSLGRIVRLEEDKIAVFINLYIPETQEVSYIKNKLKSFGTDKVKWIESIEEIIVE